MGILTKFRNMFFYDIASAYAIIQLGKFECIALYGLDMNVEWSTTACKVYCQKKRKRDFVKKKNAQQG